MTPARPGSSREEVLGLVETSRVNATSPADAEGEEVRHLLDEYKGVTARLVASHDTLRTQLAGVRQELAEKNRELERKKRLEALGRVAAGVAHEFRNPLGGIRLTIDSLRRTLDEPGERLDRIDRAVHHLDHIVEDLLTFTRDQPIEVTELSITDLIASASEIAFGGVEGQQPDVDCTGDPHLMVSVDRHAFTQVLVNLLDNARKVMVASGAIDKPGPHLAIGWGQQGATLWIEMTDRGPGIPPGEEERIFHPFHSLREEGTGLGLAIVHSRVEAHGGEISVVSERWSTPKQFNGACFRIELPQDPKAEIGSESQKAVEASSKEGH